MNKKNRSRSATLSCLLTALGVSGLTLPGSATAQTAASADEARGELEQVVVTVQRRPESIQSVPVTVEDFSAAQMEASAVTEVTDLGVLAPGLVPATQFGYFQPHLRGVGTTAPGSSVENPVALYVDGVYYASQGGSMFALPGIDHIELDKGPQGTLFGRNATGGLIQIVTMDPQQRFAATASLLAGNYATLGASAYLNGGLTENLASNLSFYYQDQRDGFGTNYFNGQDVNATRELALRQKNLFTLSARDSLILAFNYEQTRGSPVLIPAPGTTPLGGPPYTGSPWSANGFYQPFLDLKQGGVSVKFDHDFGFAQLESISAYLTGRLVTALDGTLVVDPSFALNILPTDRHRQYTQEIDLRSSPGSRVTWTAGLFYLHGDFPSRQSLEGGLLAPLTSFLVTAHSRNSSYAAFAQASTQIFPGTTLTLGARETFERKRFSEGQYGSFDPSGTLALLGSANDVPLNSSKPTWRISLDHRFTGDILAYVSYNRGYKSGGFNELALPVLPYQPETLDAYEIGAKSDLLERHLRANAAAFYYDYKNLQTVSYPAGTLIIYSAPKAKLYGMDLDVQAVVSTHFTLAGGLEFLHATYGDFPGAQLSSPAPFGGSTLSTFNADGRQLPLAPRWTADIAPVYVLPLGTAGSLTMAATYSYNSGFYYEPDNRLHQGGYSVLNTTATWDSVQKTYSLRLWAKNLTNKAYTTAMYAQTNGDYAQYAPPRTFGITATRSF